MEFLFIADIVKPDGMEDKEFFQIWKAESEAATAALDAGQIKSLWKAAGQYKVVGIFFIFLFIVLGIVSFGFKLLSPFVPFAFITGGLFSGLADSSTCPFPQTIDAGKK